MRCSVIVVLDGHGLTQQLLSIGDSTDARFQLVQLVGVDFRASGGAGGQKKSRGEGENLFHGVTPVVTLAFQHLAGVMTLVNVERGDGLAVLLKVLEVHVQMCGRCVDLIFGWVNAIHEEVLREHHLQMEIGAKRFNLMSHIGIGDLEVTHIWTRSDFEIDALLCLVGKLPASIDAKALSPEVIGLEQSKGAKRLFGLQDVIVKLPILLQSGVYGWKVGSHDVVLFERI